MKKINLIALFTILSIVTQAQETAKMPIPEPEISTTTMTAKIAGSSINLIAEAGTMLLRDESNLPIALIGHAYYQKQGGSKDRPIVFAYNGGPGSSSFWLHMGALGPKRIAVDDPNFNKAAPYKVINNEYSILDVADLVMIDPVGTGLSIPAGEADFKDFWGVDQDIRSISLFVTQFLIEKGRMNSPKYLLGESYGTFRNAGVMSKLLNQGIAMNGVIMVSAVFDLRTLVFPPNEDISYISHFPTYAATAWYHDKISDKNEDLYAFLDEIRSFTEDEYMPALFKGDRLSAKDKSALAQKLGLYTGTDSAFWERADLRVRAGEFFAEMNRDQQQVVGRLDSRYLGMQQDGINQIGEYDPQSLAISPAYIQGFLDYLHEDLGVSKKLQYTITAGRREGFAWDWSHEGNERWGAQAAIHTGIDMAEAMIKDPNVKVLILNGIYDLATVFYGVEYTVDHMGLPKKIRDNIIMEYYEAGHMMYTDIPSLIKFKKDVGGFIMETSQ